jgi:hypothetical protein
MCETGYYLNNTDITVCTICPEDCLACMFYLNRVYCTLCPAPLYTQVSGFSPYSEKIALYILLQIIERYSDACTVLLGVLIVRYL